MLKDVDKKEIIILLSFEKKQSLLDWVTQSDPKSSAERLLNWVS